MAERDSGWIQLYCENVQDIYDTMIMAYRIAEDQRVLTPAMVCLDGFFLSHSMQKLVVPEQEEIDAFVGEYCRKNMYLDPEDPLVIDNLTGSNEITEMKYQQARGFVNAEAVMEEVFEEFERKFGRRKSMVEGYNMETQNPLSYAWAPWPERQNIYPISCGPRAGRWVWLRWYPSVHSHTGS